MINFSLNTCWRLIPTTGKHKDFSLCFLVIVGRAIDNKSE